MLATPSQDVPAGDEWFYEAKLDGLRCIAIKHGGEVRLLSRNRLSYDARFGNIRRALQRLPLDEFVLDGEIVSYDNGRTSFSALQREGVAVLCVFDVSSLLGRDVTLLPVEDRKQLLARAIVPGDVLQLVQPLEGDGARLLAEACRQGREGLVAKRRGSVYVHGRSRDWLKIKCLASQELVVGGWTDPKGVRKGLGALLVGHYEGDRLRYAGKVGTGFSHAVLDDLYTRLSGSEVEVSPFDDRVRQTSAHWCEPRFVVQVSFSEWTPDGRLRHPRYEGLRTDKDPFEVRRER